MNSRNGYRDRRRDTRVGTIDLPVPKLREGTYFPAWLLTHRRRAELALTSIVAQAYLGDQDGDGIMLELGGERAPRSRHPLVLHH